MRLVLLIGNLIVPQSHCQVQGVLIRLAYIYPTMA